VSESLTSADLAAEGAVALPTKEVMSLLDLNADVDLGLDLAAPVDLAVAANLNVAAPIEAAASANVLSVGSEAVSSAGQQVLIDQGISGDAIANAPQDATVDQAEPAPAEAPAAAPVEEVTTGSLTDGNLLNIDVDIAADADIAAPIAGAVAANGNIAAPIDASVAANIGSVDSQAVAVSEQTAIINQSLDGVTAEATADQDATVTQ
jgi:hypothetical protein